MSTQFFLKFGQREHIRDLLENGHLFINHSTFFKKKDSEFRRFDINEGRQSIKHYKDMTFEFRAEGESTWKKLFSPTGKFETWTDLESYHLYCLYNISIEDAKAKEYYPLDPEIKKMGDAYLLIQKPRIFVERLLNALQSEGFKVFYGQVNYYDESIDQTDLGFFAKTKEYGYQQEYRFIIKSSSNEPLNIYLGSLEDIAELIETSKHVGFRFIWP